MSLKKETISNITDYFSYTYLVYFHKQHTYVIYYIPTKTSPISISRMTLRLCNTMEIKYNPR